MNGILDSVRVLLCLFFMVYASWSDWKKREVSNKVWAVLAPLAFFLTSIQYVLFNGDLLLYLLSFAVTSGLAIVLFYAGAFGGADAKALICLSLALPQYPASLSPVFTTLTPEVLVSSLFPIIVFSNSVLLAALTVVYALLRNLSWKLKTGSKLFEGFEEESFGRKMLALLTGYKINTAKLERYEYLYPLEDIGVTEGSKAERRLLVMPKDENREQIVRRILDAARTGKIQNSVWATPGLPMLVFITVGLLIALVFGDIVGILLFLVFK
ncbi:MAG: prepilin peptidase [Candidatus Bathyarchaeota archaeon]|nr:prepilin peptidase [Candidatus Bathyarchaeota archaeon]